MQTEFQDALQTSVIREILRPVSPIASVYWVPPAATADEATALTLQRRRVAGQLAEQAANNETIDAVVGYLARLSDDTASQAIFARFGHVLLAYQMPETAVSLVAYGAPPKLGPLLMSRRLRSAYASMEGLHISGAEATIEALVAGAVQRLVIVDDPSDDRLGWFGPDLLCATDRVTAFAMDRFARCGHLADIVIRAAVLTGAEVEVVDAEEGADLPGGMAAWVI